MKHAALVIVGTLLATAGLTGCAQATPCDDLLDFYQRQEQGEPHGGLGEWRKLYRACVDYEIDNPTYQPPEELSRYE